MSCGSLVHVHGSDFHLRVLQGVVVAFPLEPVDAVGKRIVVSIQVLSVQVGLMTVAVPPSTFVGLCTGRMMGVVVLIFSAELPSQMNQQRITFTPQQIHVLNCVHVM